MVQQSTWELQNFDTFCCFNWWLMCQSISIRKSRHWTPDDYRQLLRLRQDIHSLGFFDRSINMWGQIRMHKCGICRSEFIWTWADVMQWFQSKWSYRWWLWAKLTLDLDLTSRLHEQKIPSWRIHHHCDWNCHPIYGTDQKNYSGQAQARGHLRPAVDDHSEQAKWLYLYNHW